MSTMPDDLRMMIGCMYNPDAMRLHVWIITYMKGEKWSHEQGEMAG